MLVPVSWYCSMALFANEGQFSGKFLKIYGFCEGFSLPRRGDSWIAPDGGQQPNNWSAPRVKPVMHFIKSLYLEYFEHKRWIRHNLLKKPATRNSIFGYWTKGCLEWSLSISHIIFGWQRSRIPKLRPYFPTGGVILTISGGSMLVPWLQCLNSLLGS